MKPIALDQRTPNGRDFERLQKRGLKLISESAGDVWTNYNPADPGVTILDELVFGLTDLLYLADRPVQDFLAEEDGSLDLAAQAMFPPDVVMVTGPVTLDDYRELVLDRFPFLSDVRLQPSEQSWISGRYRVELELAHDGDLSAKVGAVTKFLNSHRNLCEQFAEVSIVEPDEVGVSVEVTIEPGLSKSEVAYTIFERVTLAVCPPQTFLSRDDLLVAGESIEEIYDGPRLSNGFLPPSELPQLMTREELVARVSRAIVETPGVLRMSPGSVVKTMTKHPLQWRTPTDPNGEARRFRASRSNDHWDLRISVGEGAPKPFVFNPKRLAVVADLLPRRSLPEQALEPAEMRGRGLARARYHSIQNQFPSMYKLATGAVSEEAPAREKAEVKQLKGYLMTFEQLLANFVAQARNVRKLFSLKRQERTYFSEPLYNVPGARALFVASPVDELSPRSQAARDRWSDFESNSNNPYRLRLEQATEDQLNFMSRRERFLDSLLARFGESFPLAQGASYETRHNKRRLLSRIAELGEHRFRGLSLVGNQPSDVRPSTLEERLQILLSRDNSKRPPLASLFEPGSGVSAAEFRAAVAAMEVENTRFRIEKTGGQFRVALEVKTDRGSIRLLVKRLFASRRSATAFRLDLVWNLRAYDQVVSRDLVIVETNLLAPNKGPQGDDTSSVESGKKHSGAWKAAEDFFSQRLIVVLANWTAAPVDEAFRYFVDQELDNALPAHVLASRLWISDHEMFRFRRIYDEWVRAGCHQIPDGDMLWTEAGPKVRPGASGEAAVLLTFLLDRASEGDGDG